MYDCTQECLLLSGYGTCVCMIVRSQECFQCPAEGTCLCTNRLVAESSLSGFLPLRFVRFPHATFL